ncbi:hypothetical protein ADK57_29350 [Streptomyces sp. MMG1533]|nr:hypothetical protein ADK57_29350 [Streptomyces sp. MMG1533]
MDDLITQYALTVLDRQSMLDAWSAIPWPDTHRLEIAKHHKAALQEQWYAGEISDGEYFSQLARQETEIKRLVNEQQTWMIRHRPGAHQNADARSRWDGLSMTAKRETLYGLLESVIILPGTKGSHRFEPSTVIPVRRTTPKTSAG